MARHRAHAHAPIETSKFSTKPSKTKNIHTPWTSDWAQAVGIVGLVQKQLQLGWHRGFKRVTSKCPRIALQSFLCLVRMKWSLGFGGSSRCRGRSNGEPERMEEEGAQPSIRKCQSVHTRTGALAKPKCSAQAPDMSLALGFWEKKILISKNRPEMQSRKHHE